MEPVRFFYSTDGTDAHGPVTVEGLRLLAQNKVISPTSYLCREGETEWRPLSAELISRLVVASSATPYVPTPEAIARMNETHLEDEYNDGPCPGILTGVCWAAALGAAAALTWLRSDTDDPGSTLMRLVFFAGYVAIVMFLPYLISKVFKRPRRLRAWAVGTVVMAIMVITLQIHISAMRLAAATRALNDQMKADALTQIAEKGFFEGNSEQGEAHMEKLKQEIDREKSETSRLIRSALVFSKEIIEKIKATETAEKACGDFDPATFTSRDDITALRGAIAQLRVAQVDVLNEFENYDDRLRAALAQGNFGAEAVDRFILGAHRAGHIDQVISIWQLKIKLSDDHLARLNFLEKRWGSWNAKDGKLLFSDKDNLDAYDALSLILQNDVKNIGELQKQVSK